MQMIDQKALVLEQDALPSSPYAEHEPAELHVEKVRGGVRFCYWGKLHIPGGLFFENGTGELVISEKDALALGQFLIDSAK